MSDGQFIEGLHKDGDAISVDDQHIAVLAQDGSNNYAYLELGDNGGLKVDIVDATGITVEVDIDQYVDGFTIIGGEQGTVAMGSDGTNLQFINVDSAGTIAIQDNGGSITVDATDLDIRDLTSASDSVEVLQATASNLNATVVATDFDIRDLDATQDNVAISDGTETLAVNVDGSINTVTTKAQQEVEYGNVAVAKSANATIVSYSPSAGTVLATGIEVSALGYSRWEISYGTTASEVLKIVKWTTPSNPSLFIDIDAIPLASTETILVQGFNENNRPGNMEMYASIRHDV